MIPNSITSLLKKKAQDMMPSGFDFGKQEEEDSDVSSFLDNEDLNPFSKMKKPGTDSVKDLFGGGDKSGDSMADGFSNMVGGAMGAFGFGGGSAGDDFKEKLTSDKTESGGEKPLHENKDAAKVDLLSKQADPPPKGTPMDESFPSGNASQFGTTHIRPWVRHEFMRRERNVGMNYTNNGEYSSHPGPPLAGDDGDFSESYEDTLYRGPKTAWMRVVSNAIAPDPNDKTGAKHIYGFELGGVANSNANTAEGESRYDSFEHMYGFDKETGQGTGKTFMGWGYDSSDKGKKIPHMVEEADFFHRPSPGINSIKSEDKDPGANIRETTISFTVFSRSQLDYIDDYFFKPSSTMIVEWGWNTYPRSNAVDYSTLGEIPKMLKGSEVKKDKMLWKVNQLRAKDEGKKEPLREDDLEDDVEYCTERGTGLLALWNDAVHVNKQLKAGKGNYGLAVGAVNSYSFNLRDDGGYDCEVKICSMAAFGMMTSNDSSAKKGKKDADKKADQNKEDFKYFIENKLDEILADEGDGNDWWDWGDSDDQEKHAAKMAGSAYGRFFQFDQSIGGKDAWHSDHEDCYITVGYFIDIVNFFFSKKMSDSKAQVFQFSVGGCRCVAHPNIKSTDGKVLLIPNAMSPRYNKSKRKGRGYKLGEGGYKSDVQGVISDELFSNDLFGNKQDSFLQIVNAETSFEKDNQFGKVKSLSDALEASPRDDLFSMLSAAAKRAVEQGDLPEGVTDCMVKPFPDYVTIDGQSTDGFSGRIKDLFINYNVIKDSVSNGQDIRQIIKDILKKVSTAAGEIWDFDLVGADTATANSTTILIVDKRYAGLSNTYDLQKESQTWKFKSHTKNSIVKSLSLDISISEETAAQAMYPEAEQGSQANFHSRGRKDRVLDGTAQQIEAAKKDPDKPPEDEDEDEDDIESEEKFIVGQQVGARYIDIECVDPDSNRMLGGMKKDQNKKNSVKNNIPLDGCEVELELDGIEGVRLLDVFTCTGVPTRYYMNGHWRAQAVSHEISGNDWKTTIKGEYLPSPDTTEEAGADG